MMESLRRGRKLTWQGHVDGPTTRKDYLKHFYRKDQSVSFAEREQEIYRYRQALLIEHFKKGYPIISGHVPFIASLRDSYPDYFFLTVVRHPIERWLSYFNFCLKKGLHTDLDIETVRKKGISYGLDVAIESESGIFEASLLSLFFSEAGKRKLSLSANLLEHGCSTLDVFDCIGQTRDMTSVEDRLLQEGFIKKPVEKRNVTKTAKQKSAIASLQDLSHRQKARLENLCSADLELYEKISRRQ